MDAMAKRTTFVELFFDLVFVFAITQVAATIHADHSAAGWVQAALLLWLMWWAWSQYTWAANAIDVDSRQVRIALLAVTGLTLVAAIALPEAFADRGALFAVPYALVRLAGLAMYWLGLRGEPEHQAALRSYLPVALASPFLVLAGGLAPDGARAWLWGAAVVVDVTSVIAAGRGEFRVAPVHFAERHGLIVIIALGESIIAIGATMAGLAITPLGLMSLVLAFAVTALLWWAYFDRSAEAMEHVLVGERDAQVRGRTARDVFTLGHLPIVAGIILFAVGVEEVLLHPSEAAPGFGRLAMGLGVALFMWGFAAARARGAAVPAALRAVAGVAVLAACLLLPGIPGYGTLLLIAVAVACTAAMEAGRITSTGPARRSS